MHQENKKIEDEITSINRPEVERSLKSLTEAYYKEALSPDEEYSLQLCKTLVEAWNERDRYKRALQELKVLGQRWPIFSDSRGVAIALIETSLHLEIPLKVMRAGKWVDASSCEPIIIDDQIPRK